MAKIHLGECVDAGNLWITFRDTGMKCPTRIKAEKWEFTLKSSAFWERKAVNPKPGEIIGVRDSETNKWRRGQVTDIDTTGEYPFYKIFMIDYGRTLNVFNNELCAINEDFKIIPPLAFKFCLYGIVPVQIDPNSRQVIILSKWSNEANSYVDNLCETVAGVHIKPKAASEESFTIYGDLYLVRGNKITNLSDLLIEEGFAKRDEALFCERCSLDLNKENVQVSNNSSPLHSPRSILNFSGVNDKECEIEIEEEITPSKTQTSIDAQDGLSVERRTPSPTVIRTFYPAGFNMDTADKLFLKFKANKEKNKALSQPSQDVRVIQRENKGTNPPLSKNVGRRIKSETIYQTVSPASTHISEDGLSSEENAQFEDTTSISLSSNVNPSSRRIKVCESSEERPKFEDISISLSPNVNPSSRRIRVIDSTEKRPKLEDTSISLSHNVNPTFRRVSAGGDSSEKRAKFEDTTSISLSPNVNPTSRRLWAGGDFLEERADFEDTSSSLSHNVNTTSRHIRAGGDSFEKRPKFENKSISLSPVVNPTSRRIRAGGDSFEKRPKFEDTSSSLSHNVNPTSRRIRAGGDSSEERATFENKSISLFQDVDPTSRHTRAGDISSEERAKSDNTSNSLSHNVNPTSRFIGAGEDCLAKTVKLENTSHNFKYRRISVRDACLLKDSGMTIKDFLNNKEECDLKKDSRGKVTDGGEVLRLQENLLQVETKEEFVKNREHNLERTAFKQSVNCKGPLKEDIEEICLQSQVPVSGGLERSGDVHLEEEFKGTLGFFIKKQLQNTCLVHGTADFGIHERVSLDPSIEKELADKKDLIPRIYESAWPVISQRKDVIMVDFNRGQKRLTYITPLVNLLVSKNHKDEIPKGNGPVLLILSSGSSSVQEIADTCISLLKGNRNIKITAIYGGDCKSALALQTELVNGCHILISTPLRFLQVLDYGELIFNFKRLRYFVLDEADILMDRFPKEMRITCVKLAEALKKKRDVDSFQVVFSAEKWFPTLDKLAKMISSPVICIASFIEAVVYSKLKPRVHLLNLRKKLPTLIDFLKERGYHRTLVVCSNAEEVLSLKEALKQHKLKNVFYAAEYMPVLAVHDVALNWRSSANPVLICCDVIFQELKIEDASRLINYSLPERKRDFDFRFSCLIKCLPSILEEKRNKNPEATIDIFIAETDSIQLPFLVNFLKRVRVHVHPNLEARMEVALEQKEHKKRVVPLCPNVKSFGECWTQQTCGYRHVIIDLEKPPVVPMFSTVRLRIFTTYSASRFGARILEYIDSEGNSIPLHNRQMEVIMKLHKFFKDDRNKTPVAEPVVYGLYAREGRENAFKRSQIVADAELDRNRKPVSVYVNDIDDGIVTVVKVSALYELPEDLKNIPQQSVELILCNLSPIDRDWNWSPAVWSRAEKLLAEAFQEGRYWQGQVKASLANCIWVEPLDCYHVLPSLKTTYPVFSVRSRLIKDGLADDNPIHIKLLYEVLKKGGFEIHEEKKVVKTCATKKRPVHRIEAQWAFLSCDEYQSVTLVTGDTPGKIFVRLTKFEDLLEKLTKKISKFADEKRKEQVSDDPLAPGDYCIGNFQDGEWYRACVRSIEQDTLDLFFVDYGDVAMVNKSDVFRAPEQIFTQLPFQAIECELACVAPPAETWPERAYEILFDMCDDPTVDAVCAKVLDKKEGECTGGSKYSVVLITVKDNEKTILNQLLVNEGVALQNEEQKIVLNALDLSRIVCIKVKDDEEQSSEVDDGQSSEVDDGQSSGQLGVADDGAEVGVDSDCSDSGFPNTLEERIAHVIDGTFNFDCVDDDDVTGDFFENLMPMLKSQNKLPLTWKEDPVEEIVSSPKASDDDSDDSEHSEHSDCIPRLVHTIKHPLVIWRQDNYFVRLEIDVCGVLNYYLEAELFKLSFCTEVNDELCGFVMNLWGAVNPGKVERKAGGVRFLVTLHKLHVGVFWDHLLEKDKKVSWVKYNVNSVLPAEEEAILVRKVIETAREESTTEFTKPELKISSGGEEEDEEEEDLVIDQFLSDPYDPLN